MEAFARAGVIDAPPAATGSYHRPPKSNRAEAGALTGLETKDAQMRLECLR